MGNVYRMRGQVIGNAALPGTTDRQIHIQTGDDIENYILTRIPAANSADYAVGTIIWMYLVNNSTDKTTIEAAAITVKQHRLDD